MLKIKKTAITVMLLLNVQLISAAEIVSGNTINKETLGENYNFYVKGVDNCVFKSKIINNQSTVNIKNEFSLNVQEKSCSGIITKVNKIAQIQNSAKEIPAGINFEVTDF
jgi:hypothetical protein